jgi:addiction module HigA family antidote
MRVTVIHPGEHLSEELKELGMSAAALARNLGVPTNRITGILNGQRAITGDMALRLAHLFGKSAEFWLNLQRLYELRVAQKKTGKAIKALPRLKHSGRKRWHVSIVRHRLPYGRGSVRTWVTTCLTLSTTAIPRLAR